MTEPRYARAGGVVWRLGPDRVLVRRVGEGVDGARDLLGGAALVWVALDERRSLDDLTTELSELGTPADDICESLDRLVADGLVVRAP